MVVVSSFRQKAQQFVSGGVTWQFDHNASKVEKNARITFVCFTAPRRKLSK